MVLFGFVLTVAPIVHSSHSTNVFLHSRNSFLMSGNLYLLNGLPLKDQAVGPTVLIIKFLLDCRFKYRLSVKQVSINSHMI